MEPENLARGLCIFPWHHSSVKDVLGHSVLRRGNVLGRPRTCGVGQRLFDACDAILGHRRRRKHPEVDLPKSGRLTREAGRRI